MENENQNKSESKSRLGAIDALRGLVIVLMALDHSRLFFGDIKMPTADPASTSYGLFLTRWVTHLCAPSFLFLAGMGAYLFGQKVQDRKKLALFLITRGLWLVVLEFTVVHFALTFYSPTIPMAFLVIAAIGSSMVLLGVLCWLPSVALLTIGLAIFGLHNQLNWTMELQQDAQRWYHFLFRPGYIPSLNLEIGYPLIPWFGAMAMGYGMAPVLNWRHRGLWLFSIGFALLLTFVVVRSINQYGDLRPWKEVLVNEQGHPFVPKSSATNTDFPRHTIRTMMSFLDAHKYPPSLAFLSMTLGPALMLLAMFDWRERKRVTEDGRPSWLLERLKVFGRVPLFFYILHFYLLHYAAVATYWFVHGVPLSPYQAVYERETPLIYGFQTLWQIYVVWICVLLVLYPLCVWFGRQKKKSRLKPGWQHRIWSYL